MELSRRELLKYGVAGGVGTSMSGWSAIAAKELGNPELALPNFVSIGNRSYGSGFLGTRYQPLVVNDPARGVENLRPAVANGQFQNRFSLLDELEQGFNRTHATHLGVAHRTTYQRALTLMMDQGARAFDIANEPADSRRGYGT